MKHAFIMDPLESVKPWKDTSYFLMLACCERGRRVCHLDQRQLWLDHDDLKATVTWVNALDDMDQPFTVSGQETVSLSEMDAVWVRTDPPFDRRYFYTTLMLDYLPSNTRVLNRPEGIRNWNEKLAALYFPDLTPRTRVTADVDVIRAMAAEFGRVTVKPIDGFGGKGIVFYGHGEDPAEIREATHAGKRWVIAQQYLPAAAQGDKRILLLKGKPLGAILRVHADGAELNNMDAGGAANPAKLNARDLEICAAIEPGLVRQGIFLAGIDIIGGQLIEVNVTSPTGLREMSGFDQVDYHHQIISALENES